MKKYSCSISQKGLQDFVSIFEIEAKNIKEAKNFARMQKTNYFQLVIVKLKK